MVIKFICCDVFLRIACSVIAKSPNIVDAEFVPMLAHTHPDRLREDLQRRINDNSSDRQYDAVALGYGLCGNAAAGLSCPVPLVMPRMHDCCTMFLGSRGRFTEVCGEALSTRWCSCGYFERGHALKNRDDDDNLTTYKTNPEYIRLLEQYGEENAEYVWQTMHPDIETDDSVYIEIDGFEYSNSKSEYKKRMDAKGKILRNVKGDISMLERLVNGPWDDVDFLVVPPGQKIKPLYDMERVVTAE